MGKEAIEEKIRELETEILRYRGVDSAKVASLCTELIQIGEEHRIEPALGYAYYFLGENYYLLSDVKMCIQYMSRGLEIQRHTGQWILAARSYNLLALNSVNQGNAPFAIEYFLNGLDCCALCNDPEEEGLINLNLGYLFLQNGENARAGMYAKDAIYIFEQMPEGIMRNRNLLLAYILLSTVGLIEDNLEQSLRARKQISEIVIEKDNAIKIILHILDLRIADRMGGPDIYERKLKDLLRICQRDYPVLEVADELLEFAQDLFRRQRYEELKVLLDILTRQLEATDILYLRLRVKKLELEYLEETGQSEMLAAAAVSYYKLLKMQDKEARYLMGSMLEVRLSLNQMTKKQREVEARNKELKEKSEMDPLTGLPNRFKLNEYSEETFEHAYATKTGFGIEILDVDFFKEFNDTYGHTDGDYCLKVVGEILRKQVEEDSRVFAARYGGDEFMVVYKDMTKQEVRAVAERIQKELNDAALEHRGSKINTIVTLSQGIHYGVPMPGNKVWDFLHAADEALYEVKRSTRDGICLDDQPILAVRE